MYLIGCFLSTANLSQLLSPSCTLADYGLQEVTLVPKSRAPGMGSALSSSDIMALQREEDKRRQQARQQHGAGTGLGLVSNKQNRSVSAEIPTI
jgi:glucokinase